MTDKELMQQALDMILIGDNVRWTYAHDRVVAEALRARLAQKNPVKEEMIYNILCSNELPPEGEHWEGFVAKKIVAALAQPEPTLVLWNVKDNRLASASDDHAHVFAIRQREWQGLTDEEIYECKGWVRCIEAKLKEKNT